MIVQSMGPITQFHYNNIITLLGHGSEQSFSQALNRLTEPKAASALSSPLVSSVLYSSMEGMANAATGVGSGQAEKDILSDSLLDEIMKVPTWVVVRQ